MSVDSDCNGLDHGTRSHCSSHYTQVVRRVLQFGVLFLSLAALLAPTIEIFDRWDPPGPSNDTELAVFGLILTLCLILLVSRLVAALDKLIEGFTLLRVRLSPMVCSPVPLYFVGPVMPHSSPPLRI